MTTDLHGVKVLVTGATGYVSSRLIPELLATGAIVRATSRDPKSIERRHPEVTTVPSDLSDPASLTAALENIEVAYYLVHSMASDDFEERDRKAAENFITAAEKAGVRKIVYLSGLGREEDQLSGHLASRHEVGRILASRSPSVIELRCAIVIGSGSVAFDMLRYLTERLPAMIAPRWLETKIQPIAENDLVSYLLAAAEAGPGGVWEIGGADVLTYREMIRRYAALRKLRRVVVGVPLLTPRLSSYWVQLMTPVPTSVSRPLIDGLRNEVVVTSDSSKELFPEVRPMGFDDALIAALDRQTTILAEEITSGEEVPGSRVAVLADERRLEIEVSPEDVPTALEGFGADSSWYPVRWAWLVRGQIDRLLTRGQPRVAVERASPWSSKRWWALEQARPNAIFLRVQLKTPGESWFAVRVEKGERETSLVQTALLRPRGLLGRLYWWGLWPFHWPIFQLMAKRMARRLNKSD